MEIHVTGHNRSTSFNHFIPQFCVTIYSQRKVHSRAKKAVQLRLKQTIADEVPLEAAG